MFLLESINPNWNLLCHFFLWNTLPSVYDCRMKHLALFLVCCAVIEKKMFWKKIVELPKLITAALLYRNYYSKVQQKNRLSVHSIEKYKRTLCIYENVLWIVIRQTSVCSLKERARRELYQEVQSERLVERRNSPEGPTLMWE